MHNVCTALLVLAILALHSSRGAGSKQRMLHSDISWSFCGARCVDGSSLPTVIAVIGPAVSVISIDFAGPHDHASRDAGALASGGLSRFLALEVALTGRAAADRTGPPRVDPADKHRNPLWGAPRIHGELLKLGFEVAQSSVAKYMIKRRGPPAQGWHTFLRNHAPDIAAMDLFVVPTISFDLPMPTSSFALTAEISSGSTSRQTRRQNGLRVK